MSNLYKLTTKCVTEVMTLDVEARGLLSENQLGTVRRVQGAKEQALLNICTNKACLAVPSWFSATSPLASIMTW